MPVGTSILLSVILSLALALFSAIAARRSRYR